MKIKLTSQLSTNNNLVTGVFALPKNIPDTKSLAKNRSFLSRNKEDQKFVQKILESKKNWAEPNQEIISLPSNPQTKSIILALGKTKDWSKKISGSITNI